MLKEAVFAPHCAPPSSALGLPTQTDGVRWSKRPSCFRCFLGCSRSPAPRLGGGSGELLTTGTPLGRVSSHHGRCPTPHQRPRRRSTMLFAPERWCAAIRRSPRRKTPQGKASSGAQRSSGPRLPPLPVRRERDNSSRPAGEHSRAPLDRRVAPWPSQGQTDLGILSQARRAR